MQVFARIRRKSGGICRKMGSRTRSYRDSKPVRIARGSRGYRRAVRRFLAGNPMCRVCEDEGLFTIAEEMDHIKPCGDSLELLWNKENWQPICRYCHEKKTASENRNPVHKEWDERMRSWDV